MEEHLGYSGKSYDDFTYYKLNFGKYDLEIKMAIIVSLFALILFLL
ncbi:hypothetical protein ACFL0W_01800 [Nanoarchaeota archaeon]